ncbi:hypothetical protein SARC_11085 [Sphaeroforma arctica JP610]|uniref:Crooked neck-like protein 1 n=1 Tax=Sphaeroforma arctica JP610 TaxID=667725 RepID=A0A0L0FIW4_9EUKA|nr:hypothetical protein SARC_11085 [Sphaeroforma arctica JP610]KNC76411.1 hypothetical protein SARC_11085 [Sphaeroforma arctica JP610]|eukprot:XP_014150313.1 hypothetical protein SARC_11085 [Sphaeroforma arctica JP610]
MEMRHRAVNHARNVWDRAVTILPRADQFWYKYAYMEEMLGNIAACRQVFERWMKWEPSEQAWQSYINMELRYDEVDSARTVYERFVVVHPEPSNWIKWAKFETQNRQFAKCRQVYENAMQFFGDDHMSETLFIAFAKFEETSKEFERARAIYKYGLEKMGKETASNLFKAYNQFEKKHGDRAEMENVLMSKRRLGYEKKIEQFPSNYDTWFDLIRLEEATGDVEKTRDTYERAIANIPPVQEKRLWKRYIYLWLNYAVYEELDVEDHERAREVYRACLGIIPHKVFTFASIWLHFARFEIRQKNLTQARKILGQAIGRCPKDKLFKGYIELEMKLREFDRCRVLYEKFLEFNPANCQTWIKYAELETALGDLERARGLFRLAVDQPVLDMPEVLWKVLSVKCLFCSYVLVWLAYATFEASVSNETNAIARARHVYEEADKHMKDNDLNEERVLVLETWLKFERSKGSADWVDSVGKKMPKKVKKRRLVDEEVGPSAGYEEYFDYIFPDKSDGTSNLKLLQMAHMWKKKQAALKEAQAQTQTQTQTVDQPKGSEEGDGQE